MHQFIHCHYSLGPGISRAFKNCILKALLKPGMAGKSLLKAPPPGANNNKEQQWEVVLKGGGGGLNVCR